MPFHPTGGLTQKKIELLVPHNELLDIEKSEDEIMLLLQDLVKDLYFHFKNEKKNPSRGIASCQA